MELKCSSETSCCICMCLGVLHRTWNSCQYNRHHILYVAILRVVSSRERVCVWERETRTERWTCNNWSMFLFAARFSSASAAARWLSALKYIEDGISRLCSVKWLTMIIKRYAEANCFLRRVAFLTFNFNISWQNEKKAGHYASTFSTHGKAASQYIFKRRDASDWHRFSALRLGKNIRCTKSICSYQLNYW
jgi:hypothetical protein